MASHLYFNIFDDFGNAPTGRQGSVASEDPATSTGWLANTALAQKYCTQAGHGGEHSVFCSSRWGYPWVSRIVEDDIVVQAQQKL